MINMKISFYIFYAVLQYKDHIQEPVLAALGRRNRSGLFGIKYIVTNFVILFNNPAQISISK